MTETAPCPHLNVVAIGICDPELDAGSLCTDCYQVVSSARAADPEEAPE